MNEFDNAQPARQRRWMRSNAHLYIRHDAYRFVAPGKPRLIGRDVTKYFEPAGLGGRLRDLQTWERKYSSDQPRVPAGRTGGGRWTDGSAAPGQSAGGSPTGGMVVGEDGDVAWQFVDMEVDGFPFRQLVTDRVDGTSILSEFSSSGDGDERHSVLSPDGNLRTFLNSGNIQKILNGAGRLIGETAWTNNGPVAQAIVPRALYGAPLAGALAQGVRIAAQKTIEAGLALYTWLSSRTRSDEVAVFAFRAQEFQFEGGSEPVLSSVRMLSREEAEDFCKFLPKVQEFTDEGVREAINDGIPHGAVFGTKVHKFIADKIDKMGETNFKAEISLLKSLEVGASLPDIATIGRRNYGRLNTVRIDAFEYRPDQKLVCIYDPKTENARLTFARMRELATTVKLNFPEAKWFIVMETKPSIR